MAAGYGVSEVSAKIVANKTLTYNPGTTTAVDAFSLDYKQDSKYMHVDIYNSLYPPLLYTV